jgi:hypothetical protein
MIDRELREALTVDPAPDFIARVRARVGREEIGSHRWSWQPIVVAIAALALVVVLVERPRSHNPATRTMSPRSATIDSTPLSTMGTTVAAFLPRRLSRGVDGSSAEMPRRRAAESKNERDSEVLISASEARAIRNLLDGVREGRIDLSSLPLNASQLEEIAFAPIVLPPAGPGEGVRQ